MAPWIIYATFAIMAVAALKMRWIPLVILIVALGFSPQMRPGFPGFADKAGATQSTSLRVLSFNIGHFNGDYAAVVDMLAENTADIIMLQEVTAPDDLAGKLKSSIFGAAYYIDSNRKTGLVLLSRFKIAATNRLRGVLTRYRIDHPSGAVTLWNIHVPRSIWSTAGQSKVIGNLIADIRRHRGPKIIAGDFNLTQYNDGLERISHALKISPIPGSQIFTYPTAGNISGVFGPWVQIDHIYASKHFGVPILKRIDNFAGSDHYALMAQLALRGKP